jgi:ABC-type amino acid transport system permease subunit
MTSKTIALRVLDGIIATVIGILTLSMAGLPMRWLSGLLAMSPREFRGFSIFIVFAALWLMHEIATSDSAP